MRSPCAAIPCPARLRRRRAPPRHVRVGLLICRASSSQQQLAARVALGLPPSGALDEVAVKAAFRSRVRQTHPDVSADPDAEAATVVLVAAYDLLLGALRSVGEDEGASSSASSPFDGSTGYGPADGDVFASPEAPAVELFVHELRCLGRDRCPSPCVARAPGAFSWAAETGAARAAPGAAAAGDAARAEAAAAAANLAVGQCPSLCIHWVTRAQRARLDALLASAVADRGECDAVAAQLDALLARGDYENGRDRGPRRQPAATGQHVDWF